MTENIYMPVKVIYGKNAVNENSSVLSELGGTCLILTGGNSAKKSGALDDALSALEKCKIRYDIFDKISANPLLSVCHSAGEAARRINEIEIKKSELKDTLIWIFIAIMVFEIIYQCLVFMLDSGDYLMGNRQDLFYHLYYLFGFAM